MFNNYRDCGDHDEKQPDNFVAFKLYQAAEEGGGGVIERSKANLPCRA